MWLNESSRFPTPAGRSSPRSLLLTALAGLTFLTTSAYAEDAGASKLPVLSILPVAIAASPLILAGDSKTFEVVVYNRFRGKSIWQTVGGDLFPADLASIITDDAYPGMSAFELDIIDWDRSPTTKLRLVLEATATPCLVSKIDNRLIHYFSPGREIRVSAVYYKDQTRLARAANPQTLCTASNGQLVILFNAPVSDMLPTTFITYDDTGSKAAVSQVNFNFPTYAW